MDESAKHIEIGARACRCECSINPFIGGAVTAIVLSWFLPWVERNGSGRAGSTSVDSTIGVGIASLSIAAVCAIVFVLRRRAGRIGLASAVLATASAGMLGATRLIHRSADRPDGIQFGPGIHLAIIAALVLAASSGELTRVRS